MSQVNTAITVIAVNTVISVGVVTIITLLTVDPVDTAISQFVFKLFFLCDSPLKLTVLLPFSIAISIFYFLLNFYILFSYLHFTLIQFNFIVFFVFIVL
jgi:hypothetical protein